MRKKTQKTIERSKVLRTFGRTSSIRLSDCYCCYKYWYSRTNFITLSKLWWVYYLYFYTNNRHHRICHYFMGAPWPSAPVSQFVKNSICMFHRPSKVGRGTGKAFLCRAMGRFFMINIRLACYSMPKDKGLHFHQLPRRYGEKGFHRVVQHWRWEMVRAKAA